MAITSKVEPVNEIEQTAEKVFVALMQADGLDGDSSHFKSLAKRAFRAAQAFAEVRDSMHSETNVFGSAAVPRP